MSLLFNVLSGYPTGLTGACCRLRGTGSSSPGRHSKHTGISPLGGGCHYPYHRAYRFSSVQLSRSVMSDSLRPHESQHARPPCPSPTPGVHSLMSIESVMPSSHLILCRPLLLLPPIPPRIRVFSNESTLRMRWPKYWSFSFSIIPSKEIPGLISFRIDWLDLLAVQGTTLGLGCLRPDYKVGAQPHLPAENWIKDLLSMALHTRTSLSFPHSLSLPSGRLHKPLILIYQRVYRMKTTVTEN